MMIANIYFDVLCTCRTVNTLFDLLLTFDICKYTFWCQSLYWLNSSRGSKNVIFIKLELLAMFESYKKIDINKKGIFCLSKWLPFFSEFYVNFKSNHREVKRSKNLI